MPDAPLIEKEFLQQLTATIEKNIANELFGVSELAAEMNMSRSNLLRKVKKETTLSVSQLIRQVRLERAMHLLRTSSFNVSEVAHQVGFSSTSYFIKCFREQFGYPPGEVGKGNNEAVADVNTASSSLPGRPVANQKRVFYIFAAAGVAMVIVAALFVYFRPQNTVATLREKSIAVLPFKNDSNDSSNVYLINGLMESTLNNLQQIKDLKVISRTSSEKYRNTSKTIPEMGRELNVSYFVEGSGQKIGDQIVLNIQLIDAATDRHLWAQQYRRQTKDIFLLQQEIAKSIVEEIQAIITPEEEKRIQKIPTKNLEAYDLFLKGRELLIMGGTKNLEESVEIFKKAITLDREFALAYACATIACYHLDAYQERPRFTIEIGDYSDKALLYDPKLAESLIAKAMFYMNKKQSDQALPYLEKALLYNPNSIFVINFLADYYCNHVPNTTKYLEYALKGVKLDAASQDSVTTSYNYLRLANALVQTGFINEAYTYINKSLDYNPNNPFGYLKAYIIMARDKDINKTKRLLLKDLSKDTTRIDIIQEVGKVYCLMRKYDSAYLYYKRFIDLRQTRQLDMFRHESMHMAVVMEHTNHPVEAQQFWDTYKEYTENDRSIYKNLGLGGYYANKDKRKALEYIKLFTREDDFQYWVLLMKYDPVFEPLKDEPEFKTLVKAIETRFWNKHNELKFILQEKGLI